MAVTSSQPPDSRDRQDDAQGPASGHTTVDPQLAPASEGRVVNGVPMPGAVLAGRYRIERELGRGGMGAVYAAEDLVVGEKIALKVLRYRGEQTLTRMRHEVRLARRVTHRNAARTFDLGEHEGLHFITMELIAGQSLDERLREQGRLDAMETVKLLRQICGGLQAAHAVGILHHDLKPANVLVEPTRGAVITDFGVARVIEEQPGPDDEGEEHRAPVGTPLYMAPEQVQGLKLDARTDIYSLGLVVYELLTGDSPFQGSTIQELVLSRLSDRTYDPRDLAPVPDALAEIVIACLRLNPDDRPESAEHLLELLRRLPGAREPDDEALRSTSLSSSQMFMPIRVGERSLAVLPFRYQGPPDDAYLTEVLGDELVDLLSMTRGLRVSAPVGTSDAVDRRDPRALGESLGVDAIIQGTIQRGPERVRISARLFEVNSGFQAWSGRFEGKLQDVFDLQDRLAKRIAEALRVELTLLSHRVVASDEAVELYLRGRQRAREPDPSGTSLETAIDLFDQCLERSPAFAPALAARADAAMRLWFMLPNRGSQDWQQVAAEAVEEALDDASHIADTYLAAARLEVSRGNFASAARHLVTALRIAPTHAAAHEYLGQLQCEAGCSKEGVQHIKLAHELDRGQSMGLFMVLRHYALRGHWDDYEDLLARMRAGPTAVQFAIDAFEYRFSLWRGDRSRALAVRWHVDRQHGDPRGALVDLLRDAAGEQPSVEELAARFDLTIEHIPSGRQRVILQQLAVETLSRLGAVEGAIRYLSEANASGLLLDADWLRLCPVLQPLRERPEFSAIRDRVQQRAHAIWFTGSGAEDP